MKILIGAAVFAAVFVVGGAIGAVALLAVIGAAIAQAAAR